MEMQLKQLLRHLSTKRSDKQNDSAAGSSQPESPTSPINIKSPIDDNTSAVSSKTEVSDEEILKSIEEVYYSDEAFDASEFILQKLPDVLDLNEIHADRQHLRRQLGVVSKKVFDLIVEKQSSYMRELQTVHELLMGLKEAIEICSHGRYKLGVAKQYASIDSLEILARHRRKNKLIGLMKSLRTIKTLQETDIRLRELLEEEDYAGAIQLTLECQKAAVTFRHFTCISELSSKLQDTLVMIEEQLDVGLSKVCNGFERTHYEKVQAAYKLLGKTQIAMDQLHMHFTNAIHNIAFEVVFAFVDHHPAENDRTAYKRQYVDLCKSVDTSYFTQCLFSLCKALWKVMHSYYRILNWHEENEGDIVEKGTSTSSGSSGPLGLEANFNRIYIRQKLEHGLGRIWQDIQQRVKTYLLATDLANFKFDDFIRVLDVVKRLMEIGEEFCGSKSEELQESLRRQSVNYFKNYHRACMDELRTFLENESWTMCPVKSDFNILNLAEFRFLNNSKCPIDESPSSEPSSPVHASEQPSCGKFPIGGLFQRHFDGENPFDFDFDDGKEDVLESDKHVKYDDSDSDDSDVADELKQDFVDEQTGEHPTLPQSKINRSPVSKLLKLPITTNTSLSVMRLFGKYIHMMNVLKPIAFDMIICMARLFEYYMYAVYIFFGTDTNEDVEGSIGNKLKGTLKRIEENMIYNENTVIAAALGQSDKVPKPRISPVVDLTCADKLFGLAERLVAAESLVFLAKQLEFLEHHLELLIPQQRRAPLQKFYTFTVNLAPELRHPIYGAVAVRALDYDHILNLMANVRWDIRDIMSQHSTYVDVLLQAVQKYSFKLEDISKDTPIPLEAYNILWEYAIRLTNRTLVEGFACAKKCTHEGRALMQLDFQQFLIKLEKITDLRPIPNKELVEAFIKAYYMPESALEEWFKKHREYSPKQLVSLVNCVSDINKKSRQKLLTVIEELDKLH